MRAGNVQPTLEWPRPLCWVIRAAGSLKCRLALTPGSDPESASSFLRGASSWRSGHPVCGPWRSAARNWRWPCPPRRTQQARTPGWPVRAKLCLALFPGSNSLRVFCSVPSGAGVCACIEATTNSTSSGSLYLLKTGLDSVIGPIWVNLSSGIGTNAKNLRGRSREIPDRMSHTCQRRQPTRIPAHAAAQQFKPPTGSTTNHRLS